MAIHENTEVTVVGDLIAFVNRYRTEQIPLDFTARFLDYDWTVNDRRRIGVRWW
jgi:hypothetical protein